MFLCMAAHGWAGEYAAELTAKAHNPTKLSKIFSRARLVAYRYCIDEHDALHHLISHDKLKDI